MYSKRQFIGDSYEVWSCACGCDIPAKTPIGTWGPVYVVGHAPTGHAAFPSAESKVIFDVVAAEREWLDSEKTPLMVPTIQDEDELEDLVNKFFPGSY